MVLGPDHLAAPPMPEGRYTSHPHTGFFPAGVGHSVSPFPEGLRLTGRPNPDNVKLSLSVFGHRAKGSPPLPESREPPTKPFDARTSRGFSFSGCWCLYMFATALCRLGSGIAIP
jgi:hypothetical protein